MEMWLPPNVEHLHPHPDNVLNFPLFHAKKMMNCNNVAHRTVARAVAKFTSSRKFPCLGLRIAGLCVRMPRDVANGSVVATLVTLHSTECRTISQRAAVYEPYADSP